MTQSPLFIRVSENNGDRLYFLSCTKCGMTKEDYPPPFFKRTESAFKRASFFGKLAITTFFLAFFDLLKTL